MTDAEHAKSAPADRATAGPFDVTEVNPVRPYIELGGIKLVPRPELAVRLEIEEATKRVVAVALDYAESTLQLQPFAAPRSSGLWHEIRAEILAQIAKQGGRAAEGIGPFGPEIRAEIPEAGGSGGSRLARFIGVDGPRWFLRGVISGQALASAQAAAKVEDLFRSVVVVRGSTPMPPRDLIALQVPASAAAAADSGAHPTPSGPTRSA